MAEKVQIENRTLVRDLHSKALLETDPKVKDDYITKRRMLNRTKAQADEINTLKEQVKHLTALVEKLVNGTI
jgi:hypothetical protein